MKVRKGSRPITIWLFCAAYLAAALLVYTTGLQNLVLQQQVYAAFVPQIAWNCDFTIVALSAVFSVAFIPMLLICLFASRIARWIVSAFAILELLNFPQKITFWANSDSVGVMYLTDSVLILLALIMLFLPASNRWFSAKQPRDQDVFR